MSKKKSAATMFNAVDIRERVRAEAERDAALAQVAAMQAAQATALAAPPPAPPAAPAPPPPTAWEQHRALASNPAAQAIFALDHHDQLVREHRARGGQ